MTFGEKLQKLRAREGLSQDALAELLNVSRQAVSRWERDETMPETEKVVRISDCFHVTTAYLLKDGPEHFPPASRPLPDPGEVWNKYGFVLGWLLALWGCPWLLLALFHLFDGDIWPTGMAFFLSLLGRGGSIVGTGVLLALRWRRAGCFRRQDLGWALALGSSVMLSCVLLSIFQSSLLAAQMGWNQDEEYFMTGGHSLSPGALLQPLLFLALGLLLALLPPRKGREKKTE